MQTRARHVYQFGAFRLDATDRLLYRDGEIMALPPKVLDTLLLLVENNGRVLSKREMMEHLWPETFVEEGTLTQYIFLLRKALGDSASWIENHPRRGYRFTAPVEEQHNGIAAQPTEEDARLPAAADGAVITPAPGHRRFPVVAAGLVLLAVLAAAAVIRVRHKQGTRGSVNSVAVLPFRTAADTESDYLADGMTDAVITKLANLRGLQVVSYSRVRRYKGSSLDAADIGRQLGVQAVIEGTVRGRAEQMRVSVHAIDTASAHTLWADDRFEVNSTTLPDIERQVAEAIALRLKGRITSSERDRIRKSGPRHADAYDLVLRARAAIKKADKAAHWGPAAQMLQRAVELDPAFADAHGWLALTMAEGSGHRPERLRTAISHANQALSADPNSLIAIRALVTIQQLSGRTVEGLVMARQALDANPDDLDAIAAAAHAYFRAGLTDRAIPLYEKALRWEPENGEFRTQLARIYFFHGEHQKGIGVLSSRALLSYAGSFGLTFGLLLHVETGDLAKAVQVVRAEQSSDPPPLLDGFSAYCRGAVLEAAGDVAGARRIWTEFVQRGDALTNQHPSVSLYGLSLNHARLQNRKKALDCVRGFLTPDPRHPNMLFFASEVHALLGNRREALASLKAAVDNGFLNLPMIDGMARSRVGTLFSLRSDAEFLSIRSELARRIDELRKQY